MNLVGNRSFNGSGIESVLVKNTPIALTSINKMDVCLKIQFLCQH